MEIRPGIHVDPEKYGLGAGESKSEPAPKRFSYETHPEKDQEDIPHGLLVSSRTRVVEAYAQVTWGVRQFVDEVHEKDVTHDPIALENLCVAYLELDPQFLSVPFYGEYIIERFANDKGLLFKEQDPAKRQQLIGKALKAVMRRSDKDKVEHLDTEVARLRRSLADLNISGIEESLDKIDAEISRVIKPEVPQNPVLTTEDKYPTNPQQFGEFE